MRVPCTRMGAAPLLALVLLLMLALPTSGHAAGAQHSAPSELAWRTVSAGATHTIALRADGTVWAWGANTNGELGTGNTTASATPVQVTRAGGTALTDIVAVDTNKNHNLALSADGTIWAWGKNDSGQLGDGTVTNQTRAVQPTYLSDSTVMQNITQISAGLGHSVALRADGTVWTWGLNSYGQLGDTTTTTQRRAIQSLYQSNSSPVTNIKQVNAGAYITTLLRADGTIWNYGDNTFGGLGVGTSGFGTHVYAATQVQYASNSSPLTQMVYVDSGWGHSVAVRADGTVWAWGDNIRGQLADGTTTDRTRAVQSTYANGTFVKDMKAAEAGDYHTIFLAADGTVWGSGDGNSGQLGFNSASRPARVVQGVDAALAPVRNVTSISAGVGHSFLMKADGTYWGAGANASSQLSDGGTTQSNVWKPSALAQPARWTVSRAGDGYTVAVRQDGTVWAWGTNAAGQLGTNNTTPSMVPVQVLRASDGQPLQGVIDVQAGPAHVLALHADGSVSGWGTNGTGQLGNGSTATATRAVATTYAAGSAAVGLMTSIATSQGASYAVRTDGTVWAWGDNASGQLGAGAGAGTTRANQVTLASDSSAVTGVFSVAAGAHHALAVVQDGSALGWGTNADGQLADGSGTNRDRAVPATASSGSAALTNVVRAAAGRAHSLWLNASGAVVASGANAAGQLGDGTATAKSRAVGATFLSDSSALAEVKDIAAGNDGSMMQRASGRLWSWGSNTDGRLGDGTTTARNAAVPVQQLSPAQALQLTRTVAAGANHGTSVSAGGVAMSFGLNSFGQLGDCSLTNRSAAVPQATCTGPFIPAHRTPVSGGGTTATQPVLTASYSDSSASSGFLRFEICSVPMNSGATCASAGGTVRGSGSTGTLGSGTDGSFTAPSALPDGLYHWHAQAQNTAAMTSSWSNSTPVYVDTQTPPLATLLAPASGSTISALPDLSARYDDPAPGSPGTMEYQICPTSGCNSGTIITGSNTTVSPGASSVWSPSSLAGGTYFWRVRSTDAAGSTSGWTATWSFTYIVGPGLPELVAPATGAVTPSLTPSLTARYKHPDGKSGHVQFEICSTNAASPWSSNCTAGYQSGNSLSGLAADATGTWQTAALVDGQRYYWRARGVDNTTLAGGWSAPFEFVADSTPPGLVPNRRLGARSLTAVTMAWDAATDNVTPAADLTYEVQYLNGATWTALCTRPHSNRTCERIASTEATPVYFRVRAIDQAGLQGAWAAYADATAARVFLSETTGSANLTSVRTAATGTWPAYTSTTVAGLNGSTAAWQILPGGASTSSATMPAGITPTGTGRGWFVDAAAGSGANGGGINDGPIAALFSTSASKTSGSAQMVTRLFTTGTSSGSVASPTSAPDAVTGTNNVYVTGTTSHLHQHAGLSAPATWSRGESMYLESWLTVTTPAGSGPAMTLTFSPSATPHLEMAQPGTRPADPTAPAPASGGSGTSAPTLSATYSHPGSVAGHLVFEIRDDVSGSPGTLLETGYSNFDLASTGTSGSYTPVSGATGVRHWRVRSEDRQGRVSAWSAYRTYTLTAAASATLSVAVGADVALSPTTWSPGDDGTGSSVITVTSTGAVGYDLHATDQSDSWGMRQGATTNYLGDWGGTGTLPSDWDPNVNGAGGYFGLTVCDATNGRMSKWGTGTNTAVTDFDANLYAGPKLSSSLLLHSGSFTASGSQTVRVGYRANAHATAPPGTYSNTITYTVTANP